MSSNFEELSLLQKLTEASELEALAESRTELRKKKAEIANLRQLLPASPTSPEKQQRYGYTRSESPHHKLYASETIPQSSPTRQRRSGRLSPAATPVRSSPTMGRSSPPPPSEPKQSKPTMSTYAHLSPHPTFQLPARPKYSGPQTVDNLVEEVVEYIRHGPSRNPFEQNLIGNPDSFSSTFATARENLLNPDSKVPPNFQEMTPDELYNVLSAAFLIMEEERGRFKEGLEEVERFYKTKIEGGGLMRVIMGTRLRLLRRALVVWATVCESESSELKRKVERDKRVSGNAKRQIERMLFALMRKTFHAWWGEVGKSRVRSLEDQKANLEAELGRMKLDIENLVKTREDFAHEHKRKAMELSAQLELFKGKSQDKSMRNMKKFVMQWTHKLLLVTWNGWRTWVRKAKSGRLREEGIMKRWMSGTKGRCYMRWKEFVADEKRNRFILTKYAHRVKEGTMIKAYVRWVEWWRERREARRVVGRMVGGRRKEALRKGWGGWSEFVKYERIKESVEKRIEEGTEENVKDVKDSMERKMLQARLKKKELGLKMIQTLMKGCVAETFRAWRGEVKERRERRERLKRFGNRWRLSTANRVLNTWRSKTKTRKFLRTIISRMLRVREGKGVKRFFSVWRYATAQAGKGDLEVTLREVRERAAKGLEREEAMKSELEKMRAEMTMFKRLVGEEKLKDGEMKRKRAMRVLERWKTESLRRCWVGWREGARRLREERNLLEKFTRKLRMGYASKIFANWKETVKDIKRKRLLVTRFRLRYNKGTEIKTWSTWLDFVKMRRRARAITRRIIGDKDKRMMSKGYRKWVEVIRDEKEAEETVRKISAEKERKQAVAFKYVRSLIHGAMGKAFRGWYDRVRDAKAKRSLVLGFIKRMKNRTIINALNSWVDKVGVRKRMRTFVIRMLNSQDIKDLSFGLNRWKAVVAEMGVEGRERVIKNLQEQLRQAKEEGDNLRSTVEMQRAKIEMTQGNLSEEQKRLREMRMKNARGLMQTWKNKTLKNVFGGWKDFAQSEKRAKEVVVRFITRWVEQDITRAFMGWRDGIREMVRLEKLTVKYAARILRSTLWKCLSAWRDETKRAVRARVLIGRYRNRILHAKQLKVWRTWGEFVVERKERRAVALKFLRRRENKQLAMGFNAWFRKCQDIMRWQAMDLVERTKEREKVAILKKNTALVLRSIQSFINQSLSSSFFLWRGMMLRERHNKVIITRFARRWKGMHLMKCYLTWVDFVVERRELRNIVRRFLGGKNTMMLSGGFTTWRAWMFEDRERERLEEKEKLEALAEENADKFINADALARRREEEVRLRGENAARNMFAMKLKGALFACFAAWKEESRKNKVIKLRMGATFKRMLHQDLARAFQKWVGGIRTINRNILGEVKTERLKAENELKLAREAAKKNKDARVKKVLIGWMRKEMKLAFVFWRSEVEEFVRHEMLVRKYACRLMRGGLVRVFEGWKTYTKTEKRNRHVIKMFIMRFQNSTKMKVVNTWREWCVIKKRNAVLVARFRARVMNQGLFRAFNAWADIWLTKRRMRELTNRIFKRVLNQSISRGFTAWTSFIDELKREDYVVALFAKRWKNLTVYKVFKGWSGYVVKARWGGEEREVEGAEELKAAGKKLVEVTKELEMKKQHIEDCKNKIIDGRQAEAEIHHYDEEIKSLDSYAETLTREVFELEGKVEENTKQTKDLLVKMIQRDKVEAELVKKRILLGKGQADQSEVNELELELDDLEKEVVEAKKNAKKGAKHHAKYVARRARQWRVDMSVDDEEERKELEKLLGPLVPLPENADFANEVEQTAKAVLFNVAKEHYEERKMHVERVRTKVKKGLLDPSLLKKLVGEVEALEGHVVSLGEDVKRHGGSSNASLYLAGSVAMERTRDLIKRKKELRQKRKQAISDGKEQEKKMSELEGEVVMLEGSKVKLQEEFKKAETTVKISELKAEQVNAEGGAPSGSKGAFVISGGGTGGKRKKMQTIKHRSQSGNWGGEDAMSVTSEGVSTIARGIQKKAEMDRLSEGWSKPTQSLLVMSKEHETQLALARIEKKKVAHRERFNESEVLARLDRSQIVGHIRDMVRSLNRIDRNIRRLVRNVFRTRNFHGLELGFKAWAVGAAIRRQEKHIALGKVRRVVENSWASKRVAKAFNRIRRSVLAYRSDNDKVEFAAKTKVRLRTQAAQVLKAREESLRVGRSMLNKLTANKRTNILEKSFGALKRARSDKIKALSLVRRWILFSTSGSVKWAFHSWKAKLAAAEAFSSRSAFLAAADAEVRANLAFTLNRFWLKKDIGNFGVDARSDKRRAYTRWKKWCLRERERERVWHEVEVRTRVVSNVLALASSLGEREGGGERFTFNDNVYKSLKQYVIELCNTASVTGFGQEEEEKKVGEDGDDDEDNVVRGCLVMCDPEEKDKFIVYDQGGLVKIPSCGVVGSLMEEGCFGVSRQLLADARYDEAADDVVLSSAGRPVFEMERQAAKRFQTLAMKTSNVMSRTTVSKSSRTGLLRQPGDRSGSVVVGVGEIGMGSMAAVSSTNVKIPDIGMMCMPIRVGGNLVGSLCGVGRRELLEEETARNLSALATACAGGWLSLL